MATMKTSSDPYRKDNPYYSSGEHLRAKHQQTHVTSGRQFQAWALELLTIRPFDRILDAGCGWGRFTWQMIETSGVHASQIVCCDLSRPMVRTAHEEAQRRQALVHLCVGDTEALPFPATIFDLVMANHMLYHLANIPRGIGELARILKPGGRLLATTNSEHIPITIVDLHYQALAELDVAFEPEPRSPFSMENGAAYLGDVFQRVETHYFEDTTVYENATDFVNVYLTIGRYRNFLARPDIRQAIKDELPKVYTRLVEAIIAREGKLVVPVRMGAFVCAGPVARTAHSDSRASSACSSVSKPEP